MSTAPQDLKEAVRLRTDIVALIGETVSLQPQRGGRDYAGICPFHDDHNPSMRVYPDRQSYRCWVCNKGGDCFSFVMERDHVPFPEALELLARRARIELPKKRWEAGSGGPAKADLFEVNKWAEQQFHDCLLHSPVAAEAREYFASRGFTDETIRKFRLGYHPKQWEWLSNRAREKFPLALLETTGLITRRDDGSGYYHPYADRVMFPIHDAHGQVVGFGGRVLPGHDTHGGKYKNSSDSPVFFKSQLVYALDKARQAIHKSQTALVVEGYTDCIMAHQAGLSNVVATLGTALTEQHALLLKRFGRKVVLLYDGDDAGQNATERSLPKILGREIDLRILSLPGGADPAEVLQREGGGEWLREQIAQAPEVWEFKLQRALQRVDFHTVDGAQQVLEEMLGLLCQIPLFGGATLTGAAKLREDLLLGRLAQRVGLSEQVVRTRYQEIRRQQNAKSAQPPRSAAKADLDSSARLLQELMRKRSSTEHLECELLQVILVAPELLSEIRTRLSSDEIQHPVLRRLLEICLDLEETGTPPSYANLSSSVEDVTLKQALVFLDEEGREKGVGVETLPEILKTWSRRRDMAHPRPLTNHRPAGEVAAEGSGAEQWQLLLREAEARNRRRAVT